MRPLLYSHRGASIEQPENTLPSFRRAAEIGVDAFETDAHMTSDGHIVVGHDPTGGRMCGVPRPIRHTPLREVHSWDAGWGFVDSRGGRPFAGKRYRMPTLEQLLSEFPNMPLNIDLKQRDPSMVETAVGMLREHGAEQRVTLASFNDATMHEVRSLGYRGPTALTRHEVIGLLALHPMVYKLLRRRGDAAQIPPRFGPIDLSTPAFIAKCHRLGLRVDYWTINDPVQAQRLLDAGADGIMTDDPAAIAPVFERLGSGY